MNKITKYVIVILVAIVVVYVLIGINSKISNINNDGNNDINNSGEVNQSGNTGTSGETSVIIEQNESGEEVIVNQGIEYTVTSGENLLTITGVTEGDITKTNYIFENGNLIEINLVEEVESPQIAQDLYNSFISNDVMQQVYKTIDVDGNIIKLVLKQEYVDSFSGMTMDEVYELQRESLVEENN